MTNPDPAVQVATVVRLERELVEARRSAARALRETRESRGIGLRTAAKGIRISPAALSELERARSWTSRTAMKVVRYLERQIVEDFAA